MLKEPTLEYSNIESLEQLYEKDAVKFIVPWNKLYKKELFINNRYKIGRIHEDEFIVHKLLYEAKKLIYIPIDLYFYYQSQNSIMRKVFDLNRLDLLSAYIERIEFFKHIKEKSLEDKAIFMYSEEFLRHYYLVKNSITNCKKELIKIKFKYILIMPRILRLSYYTKKEKIVLMSFCINNNIYESYMKKRRRM